MSTMQPVASADALRQALTLASSCGISESRDVLICTIISVSSGMMLVLVPPFVMITEKKTRALKVTV